jgi:ribosomal protein S12 methylthiotransferase accessory factor YcaO
LQDLEVLKTIRDRVTTSKATRRFSDVPNWDTDTFEDDVEWELKCLRRVGVRRVVAVDLTKSEFDLPVVRIIIPGLEPMLESGYIPSSAAQSAMAGRP